MSRSPDTSNIASASDSIPPTVTRPGAPVGLIWAALGIVYVVWGSTYLAIRVTVQNGLPPMLSAGTRFLLAGLLLGGFLMLRRGPGALRVRPVQLRSAAIVGLLLLFGGNGMVVIAEQTVPSGLAALLVAAVPLVVVVLRAGTGDRPQLATVGGVILGFVGLALLTLSSGDALGAEMWGILLILAAATSWAIGSFLSSKLPMPDDPFVATVWEMLVGGAVMLAISAAIGEMGAFDPAGVTASGWVALIYLVLIGSIVAFTAYVWLLHSAPISLVATYAYVNPIVAVILGAVLLSEPVTAAVLIGGGIVVAAVGVVVTTERPRKPAKPAPEAEPQSTS